MTTIRRRAVLSVVTAVLLVAGTIVLTAALDGGPPSVTGVVAPRPAPPLAGPTLTGGDADLAEFRGQVVVVTIWASWCAPCRTELPDLATVERRHPSVAFLGILTRDTTAPAQRLLVETGAGGLTSVLDPDGTIAVDWGATGVPETFVIDRTGRIRARSAGPVSADWLAGQLEPLLRH